MRCLKCQYALWNIASRRCPECGEPFAPSQFEFTPGTVRFHCPHCNKAYYGTDAKGHLVPRSFNCVGCARPIDMDEMALSPAQGVSDEQTAPDLLPWLERTKKGSIRSFFRTVGWALVRPAELGRSIPAAGGSMAAWWFMFIVVFLGWTAFIVPFAVFPVLVAAGAGGRGPGAGMFLTGFGVVVIAIVGLLALVTVPVWSLVTHWTLQLTGPTRGGLPLTFGSISYSGGTNVLAAVPFFGFLFAPIWWLVSAVGTVKESQRVTMGRAAVAVLPFPIFCAVVVIGGYIALMGYTMRAAGGRAATMARVQAQAAATQASTAAKMSAISVALQQAGVANSNGVLKHPVELLTNTRIQPEELVWDGGATTPETWTISGVALAQLPLMSKEEVDQFMDRIRSAGAEGNAPSPEVRLGDCVFLTQGMDLRAADPALWTVVMWPDPGANPAELPGWQIWIARADGTVIQQFPANFDAALAEQNALRAKLGLPALRHPREVKR